jgi:hypothetical protein
MLAPDLTAGKVAHLRLLHTMISTSLTLAAWGSIAILKL